MLRATSQLASTLFCLTVLRATPQLASTLFCLTVLTATPPCTLRCQFYCLTLRFEFHKVRPHIIRALRVLSNCSFNCNFYDFTFPFEFHKDRSHLLAQYDKQVCNATLALPRRRGLVGKDLVIRPSLERLGKGIKISHGLERNVIPDVSTPFKGY